MSYHRFECGLDVVLNSVGIAHLGVRIVLSYGLQTVLSFLEDPEKVKKIPAINGPYDTTSYEVMFHLVAHTERMVAEELYQYALVIYRFFLYLTIGVNVFFSRQQLS